MSTDIINNDIPKITQLLGVYSSLEPKITRHYLDNIQFYRDDLLELLEHKPTNFLKIFKILTGSLGIKNLIKFTEGLCINFWEITFKVLREYNLEINDIIYNTLNYIPNICDSYFNEINKIYNFKNYFDANTEFVMNVLENIFNSYKTVYNYNNDYNFCNSYDIYNFLKKITKQAFSLDLWEKFISFETYSDVFTIDDYLKNYRWVLTNIKSLDFTFFKTLLHSRLENRSFKHATFSQNILSHLDSYLRIIEVNETILLKFRTTFQYNFNKIVVAHGVDKYLPKFKELYGLEAFIQPDEDNYHPLFDCLRYGNYKTVKWYYDNILIDNNIIEEAVYNVFNINYILEFIFMNRDVRVLKETLEFLKSKVSKDFIKGLDFTITNQELICKDFTKKTKLFLEFLIDFHPDNLSTSQPLLLSLINSESKIYEPNFVPFIIPLLWKLNNENRINIDLEPEIYRLSIHHKYFNKDLMKKFLDLSNLNKYNSDTHHIKRKICSFINNNFFGYNPKKIICVCRFNKMVTFIVNTVLNLNFAENQVKEALSMISSFNKNYSHFFGVDTNFIMEFIYKTFEKSLNHCNKDIKQIEKNVIDVLNIILNKKRDGIKQIGNIRTIINNLTNDYGPIKLTGSKISLINLTKILFNNGFYFNEYSLIENFNGGFNFEKYKYDIYRIYSSYFYSRGPLDDFLKFIKNKKMNCVNEYYRTCILIHELKNIINECKTQSSRKTMIMFNRVMCSKSIDDPNSLYLNDEYEKEIFDTIKDMSIYNTLKKLILKLDNKNYILLININEVIKKVINTNKNKQKTDKLHKILVNKLENIINNLQNDKKNIREKIEFISFIKSSFKIKLFYKKRLSEAFLKHREKQYNYNSYFNRLNISNHFKKNKEEVIDKTSELKNMLDELFSDEDGISENESNEECFDCINKIGNFNREEYSNSATITKPSLLSLKSLISNVATHSVISQKIDGITKKSVSLTNTFPKCHLNNMFDVEYLDKEHMNFIIGIKNSRLFNQKTFVDIIFELREKHDYTKNNTFPRKVKLDDLENICKLMHIEAANYNKYLKTVKSNPIYRGKSFWWPKMFFELQYTCFKEYIELISFFEKHSKQIGIFKNDGWILAHKNYLCNTDLISEHKIAFKIKPRNLMTVDLQFKGGDWYCGENKKQFVFCKEFSTEILIDSADNYKNGFVYRCYPVFSIEKTDQLPKIIGFEPREIRTDRKAPNPLDITRNIVYQAVNYFRIEELNKLVNSHKGDYYHFDARFDDLERKYTETNCRLFDKYIYGNVIDLGGGTKTNQYLNKYSNKIINCVSVDNDINLILKNLANGKMNKNKFGKNMQYGFIDFTMPISRYNVLQKQLSLNEIDLSYNFNTILMINSINFALNSESSTETLFNYLDKIAEKGTKLIIRWMDLDAFENKYTEYQTTNLFETAYNYITGKITISSLVDSSFVNIDILNKTNRIYYKWAHDKPIDESIIGKKDLISLMDKKRWKFIDYENNSGYDKLKNTFSLWDLYFKSFSYIVFEKS